MSLVMDAEDVNAEVSEKQESNPGHKDSYNHHTTMYGNLREVQQEAKQPFILHHLQHCLVVVDALGGRLYLLLPP